MYHVQDFSHQAYHQACQFRAPFAAPRGTSLLALGTLGIIRLQRNARISLKRKGGEDLSQSGWYVISWKMNGQHETSKQHCRYEVGELLCKKNMENIKGSIPIKQIPCATKSHMRWQTGEISSFLRRQNKQDIDTLLELSHHKKRLILSDNPGWWAADKKMLVSVITKSMDNRNQSHSINHQLFILVVLFLEGTWQNINLM